MCSGFSLLSISGIFLKYLFLNQKAKLTKAINAGTSTKGPITPANASPELILNTPMATVIASSKLFPVGVKATEVLFE